MQGKKTYPTCWFENFRPDVKGRELEQIILHFHLMLISLHYAKNIFT